MKILYFLSHPHDVGGASKQMLMHAFAMKERGHVVRVVIQCDSEGKCCDDFDELCTKYGLPYTHAIYPTSTCIEEIDLYDSIEKSKTIVEIARSFDPEIIHSLQLNISAQIISQSLGVSHVTSIYPVSDGMFNIQWENIFSEFLISDSSFFTFRWKQGLGCDAKCIRVVYQEKNLSRHKENTKNKRIELINIGVITEYKRQLEILKFIHLCVEDGICLHISFLGYDYSEYAEKCREYVKINHLEENVSFQGFVSNVGEYLSKSDFLVHASTVESYPGVIVEAMANRVPILSTPAGGIPELLIDGLNGFLTDGYRDIDIYEKFITIINKEKIELETIIENAYNTYLENHTVEAVGVDLEEYYFSVLKTSNVNSGKNEQIITRLNMFRDRVKIYLYSEYTQNHCWYLYHLQKATEKFNNVMIWGVGKYSEIGIEWASILKLHVLGFIDSYKIGSVDEYRIYNPEDDEVKSADCIIVSVYNLQIVERIMVQLKQLGRERNVNYFLIHNDPCLNPLL